MPPVSRGFHRRREPEADASRLPPGQFLTPDFPVLSAGPTPHTPIDSWSLSIDGALDEVRRWSFDELRALPSETFTVDIHCVTKWTKLDTTWTGVSVQTLLDDVDTTAEHVTAWCDGGYTTNLPLEDLVDRPAWVVYAYEGEPLEPEHGGPARLLVPHLYFWKSAKWLRGLTLTVEDEPGFWEGYGCHNLGDPWREQRYQGDERAYRGGRRPCSTRPPRRTGPARSSSASRNGRGTAPGSTSTLRLTAEDGYQAERSYSISSPPEADALEITVDRVEDGEVSPYLVDEVRAGDAFELRGPIGGHFTWSADEPGPLLLVAGGSGLAPLMAMLRHRSARAVTTQTHVLVSARSQPDVLFADELERLEPREGLLVAQTLTREAPPGWGGYDRRIDAAMLMEVSPGPDARCFVCGPTPFVERAAGLLVDSGHEPQHIHAERFGPTGGT